MRLSRIFVGLQQVRNDTSVGAHVGVSRQRVATWREPDEGVTPNLRHLALMPDDTLDHVLQELARLRAEDGYEQRCWAAPGDRARVQQLEASVRVMSAALSDLSTLVTIMQRNGCR